MWIARAVFAFLLAAPHTFWIEVALSIGNERYSLRVSMGIPMPTLGEGFFDTGKGFRREGLITPTCRRRDEEL